jgi:putative membrane protein
MPASTLPRRPLHDERFSRTLYRLHLFRPPQPAPAAMRYFALPMSYLDDPRVLFAAERTLLAWQRTAIALMGFGFVVERFGLFLRIVNNNVPLASSQRGFSLWIGVILLVIGAGASVFSALQFRTVVRGLGEKEIPRGYWTSMGVWLNYLIAAVALALAMHFVWSA